MSVLFKKTSTISIFWIIPIGLILAQGVLKFGFHEMWKDEWQAWLLSRDLDWAELWSFLYYEGHPVLWYYYLKLFTLLPLQDALALKLAHFTPFVLTVGLFWRSHLPIWLKAMVLISYPLFFEYGVVCRGYILVLFLSLLYIRLRTHQKTWSLVVLFLLCQTEIQGVFIAIGLVMTSWPWWLKDNLKEIKNHWSPLAVLMAGGLTFIATVFPRGQQAELTNAYSADPTSVDAWLQAFQGTTANVFAMGLIPDTNVFGISTIGVLVGMLILLLLHYLFRGQPRAYVFILGVWLMTFVFHSVIYPGGLRHWAMLYWAFILAVLLKEKTMTVWDKKYNLVLILLLLAPIYYNILAIKKEVTQPFSNAKSTAEFISKNVPKNVPIIAFNKFECTPVAGYLEQPLFALPDGEPFTYFKWVEKVYLPTESELNLFAKYKKSGGIILLSPVLLDPSRFPNIKEWKRFDQPSLKGENYILYTYKSL